MIKLNNSLWAGIIHFHTEHESHQQLLLMHRISTVDDIRSNFPAIRRTHNDFPVAYFDGPGGTQVPRVVGEAMNNYLFHHNANTHWAYPTSAETDEALSNARSVFSDFLNAEPEEITFGANMTTLTMHLSRSIGRNLTSNDEIIVTELDHHANIDPWRAVSKETGVTVKMVKMIPQTGQIDWDHFSSLISEKVKVIAIGAASNALGTINDLDQAISLARKVGAYIFIDAVHYAPHQLVDVKNLDCDFLACSPYKFYGPHLGVLYTKSQLLEKLDPPKLLPAPDEHGERLETGTQNHEGIVGSAAAVEFLASLHPEPSLPRRLRLQLVFDELHARGQHLITTLWNALEMIPTVTLFGPPPNTRRTPTISFIVKDFSSQQVTQLLAEEGIFTSHGDFYATTVVNRLGHSEDGLVRVGCACYTTESEVDRLIESIKTLN